MTDVIVDKEPALHRLLKLLTTESQDLGMGRGMTDVASDIGLNHAKGYHRHLQCLTVESGSRFLSAKS